MPSSDNTTVKVVRWLCSSYFSTHWRQGVTHETIFHQEQPPATVSALPKRQTEQKQKRLQLCLVFGPAVADDLQISEGI